MSGRRDGDGDAAGILLAKLEQLEAERDRLNAEVEMYKRQLMAQADLSALLEGRPTADGTGPIARVQGHRAPGRTVRERGHLRLVQAVAFIIALSGLGLKGRLARAGVRVGLAALVTAPVVHVAASTVLSPPAGTAAAASVPGWHTIGTPIPLPSPSLAFMVHPKPGLDAKSAAGVPPVTYVPSAWVPSPSSPSAPAAQPSPADSPAPAGPATLQVPVTGIDLTSGTPQEVTLTAAGGGGWVAWSVTTSGTDLDFSPSHGVLQAGQSVTVTVSLAAVQDNATSQVFTVGGQQVTVTLPGLPAVPAGAVTAVPTDTPSPAAS